MLAGACDNDPCTDPQATCAEDVEDGYVCSCNSGYILTGDNSCADIDECVAVGTTCPDLTECVNAVGTYACACVDGYEEGLLYLLSFLPRIIKCFDSLFFSEAKHFPAPVYTFAKNNYIKKFLIKCQLLFFEFQYL